MKKFFTNILKRLLKLFARATVRKYKPIIVGVTGSVGKTSTKHAIATVIPKKYSTRESAGNFNNEVGLPVTILGSWDKIGGLLFWLRVFLASTLRLIFKSRKYPDVLVLEYSADKPGDIDYLVSVARPDVAVVTAVGDIPVHVEFYQDAKEVAKEKSRLVAALSDEGAALLNYDDPYVAAMDKETDAKIYTFGFSKDADISIDNAKHDIRDNKPQGLEFNAEYKGVNVAVYMKKAIGKHNAYAGAAAIGVGVIFGTTPESAASALQKYKPLYGRSFYGSGVKGSQVIDDSYNASPLSTKAALETLEELPGERKIAVLGDMRELGGFSYEAHEHIGFLAAKFVDVLVTVGEEAKVIAEAAHSGGMKQKQVHPFPDADEAIPEIKNLVKKQDLILVKGSRAVGMDKIAEAVKK